jgi:hypothetical protein
MIPMKREMMQSKLAGITLGKTTIAATNETGISYSIVW